MKTITIATRAVLMGVLAVGVTTSACSSGDRSEAAQASGTVSIPLLATVGSDTYRLDAVFLVSGPQGDLSLATNGDSAVLATVLPAGSYSVLLQSFTLSKKDAAGAFDPVTATVVANPQTFTVFADSTTTVNFQFATNGVPVAFGSGSVDLTFGVMETAGPCAVLGAGCPDGFWCAPPALTGAPLACLPSGTTPIGAPCKSPLECVAPATCHDFGAGPVCTALCTPDEFGGRCAAGGTCAEADPSYGLCSACNPITVDSTARTVQSARFFLDFSNAVAGNPEDIDVVRWAGGQNLAQSFAVDACSGGIVEHFGNSWVPPDPGQGGKVLVGSGSTGTWVQDGASILIQSTSSGCAQSAPVPVETRYTFREGKAADTIEVERRFDFGSTPSNQAFRPYMPRLTAAFDRVIHPDAAGTTLVTENIFDCPYGCALSNWDGSWFAYSASSGPLAGQAMIVRRDPSALAARLWIDNDAGTTDTNSSSVLLLPPPGGFLAQVSERNLLCFADTTSWTSAQRAALTLPEGCTFDLACDGGPAPGCESNPCQNGGACVPGAQGGYTCQCPATITGKNCELVFTDVALGQGTTCGLRSDGRVVCWGSGYAASGVPTGTFRALSARAHAACALRTDGTIACWGFSDTGALNVPAGTFETIVTDGDHTCATHDQRPTCWGAPEAYGIAPDDRFTAVALGREFNCGTHADGTVACWGMPLYNEGQLNAPAGSFSALSLGFSESCGIRQSDGLLECWGADNLGGAPLPSTALRTVKLDFTSACALDLGGNIVCFGTGYPAPPAGSFKALDFYQAHGCAIGSDNTLQCWGTNASDYGTPPY